MGDAVLNTQKEVAGNEKVYDVRGIRQTCFGQCLLAVSALLSGAKVYGEREQEETWWLCREINPIVSEFVPWVAVI